MTTRPRVPQWFLFCWAAPWTFLGLALGLLALATGGRYQTTYGCLEFYGGVLPRLLSRVPIAGGAAALTLGHTVLGRTLTDLDRCRRHEVVHIRQYERWGVLFVPAYALSSLFVWWRGGNPYRDNPFEREAYALGE